VEVPAGRSARVAGPCRPGAVPGGDVAPRVGDDGVGVPLGSRTRGGVGASRAKGTGSAAGAGRLGGNDGKGGEKQPSSCGSCVWRRG
jgi:hypothetical protein